MTNDDKQESQHMDLPKVGDCWEEHINQGMRMGSVVAVDVERRAYLWEYDMPKGTTALVLYQGGRPSSAPACFRRRTVSYASLSDRWMRLIEVDGCGIDCLVARPQTSRIGWIMRVEKFKAKYPELFKEVADGCDCA